MPASTAEHRYRFSPRFIRRATIAILVGSGVLLLAGFAVGMSSDAIDDDAQRRLVGDLGVALVIAAFGLPLIVSAILGGESLVRGGGLVGSTLVLGMAATVTAVAIPAWLGAWQPVLFWGGIAIMTLAVVGFWILGWISGAPMWIALPMLQSPRLLTVQRRRAETMPHDRDGRRSEGGTPPGT